LKILYHHRTKSRDGQYIHIRSLIDAFNKAGHHVEEMGLTATRSGKGQEESRFWNGFVDFIPRWVMELLEYFYSLPAALWLWVKIVRRRPDFIYERYALGNFAGVLAARLSGLPLLLEVNSPLALEKRDTGQLQYGALARLSERLILKMATRILVVSKVLKQIYVDQGIDADKIVVIPNGIDPEHYRSVNGVNLRTKFGLEHAVVVGFVGFFREWHKLERVLEVLAKDLEDLNMKLLLVGDGPVREDLERKVDALGLADRVIWTGTVRHRDVPDMLSAVDIALQPEVTTYSSPLKLFDYMAAGKAIVAPRRANITEILRDGETGLLFEPDCQRAMGEALRRLACDPGLRQRLGEAARRDLYEGDYTWDSNAKRVVRLLDEAVA
jgi:glycosyltransferase involved in cell wall biosynthesis